MPAKQRFVYLGYLGLVALLGAVLAHGAAWAMAQAGLADTTPLGVADLSLSRMLGFGLAALAAIVVAKIPKSAMWVGEVADELLRVSWPSREETVHATGVVIVCVLVSAVFLGFIDATWLWVSSSVIGITPEGG